MTTKQKILIIGAGNMAKPVIASALLSGVGSVTVIAGTSAQKNKAALQKYLREAGLKDSPITILERGNTLELPPQDVVIYGAKPQQFSEVSRQYAGVIKPTSIIISIAAGLKVEDFHTAWGADLPIVRVMPHLPQALCGFYSTDAAALIQAQTLLQEMGEAITLPDEAASFHTFTVHAGSAPAFVAYALHRGVAVENLAAPWFRVAEQHLQTDAARIVQRTLEGTLEFIDQHKLNPQQFAQEVRSAKGVTNIGLLLMGSPPPQEARFGTAEELAAQNAVAEQYASLPCERTFGYALLGSYARACAMAEEPQKCNNPLYLLGNKSLKDIQRAGDSLL